MELNVRPGVQIGGMNALDDVRPRQAQEVVIPLLILRQIERPAIIRLGQPVLLDRRAIAAVEYHDLLRRHGAEAFLGGHAVFSKVAGLKPSKWQIA